MDSKQHVQVPNKMGMKMGLEPFDILVYSNIKRFMNNMTRKAFPSITTLQKLTNSKRSRICESINRLNGKCFDIYKEGRKNVYVFSRKYKSFEPFSYEFLDKPDLSSDEKAYILAAQQFMFKELNGFGKLSYSAEELAKLINLPTWDIYRLNKSLQDKGYLSIVKMKNRNISTGLNATEKIFNMNALGQAIIWKLAEHEYRITKTENDVQALQKDNIMLSKQLAALQERLAKLEARNFPTALLT